MSEKKAHNSDSNGRPYTDCYELIKAEVKQEVRRETRPVVKDFKSAVKELKDITPILRGIVNTQSGQRIWLLGLTITVLALAAIVIEYII